MSKDKANELREAAQKHRTAAQDSFDRCDTDGFLSQWAHGISAKEADLQAEIEDNGGLWGFTILTEEKTGRMLEARTIRTRYGHTWIVSDKEAEALGRKFIPIDDSHYSPDDPAYVPGSRFYVGKYSRSRVQKNLGLKQETKEMKAKAKVVGSGTGLAGAASCYVTAVCIDDLYWGWRD